MSVSTVGRAGRAGAAQAGTANFLRLRTRDYHECAQHIRISSESRNFTIGKESGFQAFTHHELRLGDVGVSLVDLDCTGEFQIVKGRPDDRYFFQFALLGSASVSGLGHRPVTVRPGEAFITHPAQQAAAIWQGQCRQLIVKIGRSAFERALAAEADDAGPPPLPSSMHDLGVAQYLKNLVALYVHYDQDCPVLSDDQVNAGFGQVVMRMLIANLRRPFDARPARARQSGPLPYYVKRAQEFIQRHAASDITVRDMVAAAGVGERSLYYGFRRWCGTTPKTYLRDLRLARARHELESGRAPATSVSQAAMNAGFSCFSQFSRLYRQRYGEYPSDTLKLWDPLRQSAGRPRADGP